LLDNKKTQGSRTVVPVDENHGNDLSWSGSQKDLSRAMYLTEWSGRCVGSEHEGVNSECETEDGNWKDNETGQMTGMVKVNEG
jgi:hypothetical protein